MKELLRGEEDLVTAFWFVGLGYFLFAIGSVAFFKIFENIFLIIFLWAMTIVFYAFYEISVWRCADNCSWVGWSILARIIVIIRAVFYLTSLYLNIFISSEYSGALGLYSIAVDLMLGVVALCVFIYLKLSGQELIAPGTYPKAKLSNTNYIKDARAKFLAGDYKGALALFNMAASIEELDDNSKSFQNLCLRRLNRDKHKV